MFWHPRPQRRLSTARHPSTRRLPSCEPLEGRSLLTLTFGTPLALGGAELQVSAATVDQAGDAYILGTFNGSVAFGTGLDNTLHADNHDMFVAKYNPSRNLLWVKSFPTGSTNGSTVVNPKGIAVDDADNAYVVGNFYGGPANFNQGPAGVDLLAEGLDAFVVKLDAAGNVAPGMVRTFGASGSDQALAVAVDPTGANVSIAGQFQNRVNFNPGGSDGLLTGATTGNSSSGFVLKLTSNLDFDWVRGGDSAVVSSFSSLAVAPTGEIYTVGPVDSGGGLLARFAAAGDLIGSARYAEGGSGNLFGPLVAVDGAGDPYVAGSFAGSNVNFNPDPATPTTLSTLQYTLNDYLVKFDPDLHLIWARRFGSSKVDAATALVVDPLGVAYLGGYITGSGRFGSSYATDPVVLPTAESESPYLSHGFVIQVDPLGNFVQGRSFDPAGDFFKEPVKYLDALALQPSGDLLVVANYEVDLQLDQTTLLAQYPNNVFLSNLSGLPAPTSPPVTISPLPPELITIGPPILTPTPSPTPNPTPPFVGPLIYNPPPVIVPTVATTFSSKTRRGISTVNLAISGDLIPAFDPRFFTVQARNLFHPKRFTRNLKIKDVSYDASTHILSLHLARPHRGAVRVTAAAGAVTTTFGLRSLAAYQTVVR